MILTEEQRTMLIAYTRVRAQELNYDLGELVPGRNEVYPIHFRNFIWEAPEGEPVTPTDLRHLVDIALQAHILTVRPVISTQRAVTPFPPIDVDIIGGFPTASPDCAGCGRPLVLENAWMADGCPCNSNLGVNSMNETRWRYLMLLQQRTSLQVAELRTQLNQLTGVTMHADGSMTISGYTNAPVQAAPGHVILELPL